MRAMQLPLNSCEWLLKRAGLYCALLLIISCSPYPANRALQTSETAITPPAVPLTAGTAVASSSSVSKPAKSDNLLQIIQTGLRLPQYDHEHIDQQLRWYRDNPAYMRRVWQRSEPFLFYIVSQIEQRGLPMELALLPIVESGYQPFGYSHARAAGLWQFIPSTGRAFGLRQDWWSDQRRDPVASTDAALTYLQQLNQRFDGNWLLAIAAYNAGAGRIERAIRSSGIPRDQVHFSDLKLSRETTAYIPKLLALARLVRHADEFDVELPVLANQPYFSIVDIGQQTDLGKISQLAGISTEQLRQLNPALNRWATDPGGPHKILVPIAHAEPLNDGLATLTDSERLRWQRHKIGQGENLGSIARRYGTTIAVLKQTNNLRGNLIRAGKHLLIPSAEALPTPLAASCRGPRQAHRVSQGDTLWDISRQYGVSVNHLKRCNPGLTAGTLAVNSTIKIRDPDDYRLAASAPAQARVEKVVNYRVRRGDSLARISTRFGVSVPQLIAWNQIDPNRYLQPGDRLIVHINLLDRG